MIDALLSGRTCGKAQQRWAKNGSSFATCKLRVSTREGEAFFANVITFSESAIAVLLALDDGDSLAVSGELTPKVWTDREGVARPVLDLLAHQVLTGYHVQRKRRAVAGEREETP